ncbi:uncharacterized protein LOC120704743 isoform X6 [Panicum virgatum]|uniref:uncharacterized protein LOC120704743 isoform X6 n=1 Tax=Panicum virgatum TaxID=38727 RepID=UPI0019D52779|nr:uncharacterized protein LOC120704743 isoform X6 [Panicum virgatum]
MGREPVQLRWAESGSSVTERTGATVLRRYGSCSIDFGRIGSIRPPPPLQIYFKHPGRSDPFQREPSSMVHLQGQPYICSPSRCRSFPQFEFLLSASLLSELTATEQKHPSNKNEHSLVESEQFTPVSVQIAALAEVPDLEAARVDRDIAAAPMEFSADWDLTGFISFEANEGSVEHMGSEHMGSLMQSIGSTNASGNEDDATSTLPRALKNMKGMVIKHQRREVICHIVGQYMSLNVMPACSPILAWSLIVGSKMELAGRIIHYLVMLSPSTLHIAQTGITLYLPLSQESTIISPVLLLVLHLYQTKRLSRTNGYSGLS